MDGRYFNLWSTDNARTDANDDVVIKSVYDPSPVGYSLPASNAFTGFTTTGGNVGWENKQPTPEERTKLNVKGDFDKGYYFYTKPNKQGILFWFPASGFRSFYSGEASNLTLYGTPWTAGLKNGGRAIELAFDINFIFPFDTDPKANGLEVRSAEEKKLIRIFKIRLLASLIGRHYKSLPRAAQAKPHPLSRLLKIKSELCRRTQPSGHSPLIITWYCFCSRL